MPYNNNQRYTKAIGVVNSTSHNDRYERQLLIEDIGVAGQKKLAAARVLIVGLGGLGAPSVQYVSAAGVGSVGLVDCDVVSVSNLQRQVVYTTDAVGHKKTAVSEQYVHALNPAITTQVYDERITSENVARIIEDYDIIIDATDNFETTFILHDAAYATGKWFIHAGITAMAGQLMVTRHGAPCLRCLLPEIPEEGFSSDVPRPVLGASVGMLGQLQAMEVMKCILFPADVLLGKVLFVDTRTTRFKTVAVSRRAGCGVCS